MSRRSHGHGLLRRTVIAAAILAGGGLLACGASIRGLYEGDVRFEHCMALDARPDVKPTLRRACWDEWVSFYTFGQPRDRTDYARLRETQLSSASDFDEADAPAARAKAAAVPDPTSALAPPPMMMIAATTDGGPPDAGPPEPLDPRTAAHARCAAECLQGFETCQKSCLVPACGRACSARFARCNGRCDVRRQGSR
jgi:hypothetical protein